MTTANVKLWGRVIGAVSLERGARAAVFEYDPAFAASGIQVSPLMMPLSRRLYSFPEISEATFHGLPGLLADCLPDKFGNTLIDAWLSNQGRSSSSFDAVERLCYVGSRAIGALEFEPAARLQRNTSTPLDVDALVKLASDVLIHRSELSVSFAGSDKQKALREILRVGTSAGGARAKAVVALNPHTGEVRSGQADVPPGFEHWLLKFDGVRGNKDKDMDDPHGLGAIEYAYFLMARASGITMAECRLLEENGRRHFMTRRFDRGPAGEKRHMQSLCALNHFDFTQLGAYSYEQAFLTIRQLQLPPEALEEQFRRMAFNIVARNQDDHVKNLAFLMDKEGQWSLSPAYDVCYSYDPRGKWTVQHQMSMNGKRDGFTLEDFRACGKTALLKRGRAETLLRDVTAAVKRWPEFAHKAGVPDAWRDQIAAQLRLHIPT